MVLGEARRMGGCDDALFTGSYVLLAQPLPLLLLPLCTFFCITYQIAPLSSAIHRNAVGDCDSLAQTDPKLGRTGAVHYENLNNIKPPARPCMLT